MKPLESQPPNRPVTFHRPSHDLEVTRDLTSRHKESGFVFECRDILFGRHARYGHGTFGEASRYADLLRASRDGTCISHGNLTQDAWDAVRRNERLHVFDLCEEIASLEGRPYPGRPWSEERAKVRDGYSISRLVLSVATSVATR